MTCEDIVIQAFGRASQIGDKFPTTRSVLYRRIGVRQQELYVLAAKINADYSTVSADGVLDAGGIDLDLLVDPAEELESIRKVVVLDPGLSGYAAGQKISLVTFEDPDASPAPRAMVLDRAIESVGVELVDVTSITCFYTKKPAPLGPGDKNTDVVLPTPHDELLVVDLARFMARLTLDAEPASKTTFLAALAEEEKELMAGFSAHVEGFVQGLESRFGPPGRTPTA